eukprot:TRINITY_DN1589_c0_g1_i18.p1 TRINITY_DN1589_c0_g1~~TRINITY_DN1589_c0_g1_i18.p1  ORF type:complete len:154 (+),score=19.88 TRINITY_DN1589_c0_g1_i18:412-873(+)
MILDTVISVDPYFTRKPLREPYLLSEIFCRKLLSSNPRYCGIFHFPVPIHDDIITGKAPMFQNVPDIAPQKFTSIKEARKQFIENLKHFGQGKYSWALEHNQDFRKVYGVAQDLVKILEQNQIPNISLWTGFEGFRYEVFVEVRGYIKMSGSG